MIELKKGDVFYDTINGKSYKCHVVQILDEEYEVQVVYKYYGKYKQWWHYIVKSLYEINSNFEAGLYTLENKNIK